MNILLFTAVIFLGFQLINGAKAPQDSRTIEQVLGKMRELNTQIMDVSIGRELSVLNGKIDAQLKEKKIDEKAANALRLQGQTLVANTQYRAGVVRNEFGRFNTAYQSLQATARAKATDPDFQNLQVELGPHRLFEAKSITAAEQYKTVVEELSKRSKTDLVFGFVPGYQLIDWLVNLTGAVPAFSYAFAAFLLALLVRGVIFPLAQKQYLYGREMAQLQPLMKELKESYTDKKTGQITNQQEFQMRTMALYKEYGINPLAGCWPALIQIPFFLMIYQCMLHYQFDFQKGTFLWINPATGASTNGFIAPNLGEKDYILVFIYMISMVVTTLMTPVSDPNNAKQQRLIGVSVAVLFSVIMFFYPLPSAFVLYWVFLNLLATAHMLYAYRMPIPPLQKVATAEGGVMPFDPTKKNGAVQKTGTPVRHRPKKKK